MDRRFHIPSGSRPFKGLSIFDLHMKCMEKKRKKCAVRYKITDAGFCFIFDVKVVSVSWAPH